MSVKPAATKKTARKGRKRGGKKAEKPAKPAKSTVTAATVASPMKSAVKPPSAAGESDITRTLEEIKKRFLEKCPRCSSAMKNTFINLGPNQRLLVNQCKVCKFYLPA